MLKVSGDLGQQRADAMPKGGFKKAGSVPKNPLSMGKPRLARSTLTGFDLPKGADTTGGVVGGLSDLSSYSGVKAGSGKKGRR